MLKDALWLVIGQATSSAAMRNRLPQHLALIFFCCHVCSSLLLFLVVSTGVHSSKISLQLFDTTDLQVRSRPIRVIETDEPKHYMLKSVNELGSNNAATVKSSNEMHSGDGGRAGVDTVESPVDIWILCLLNETDLHLLDQATRALRKRLCLSHQSSSSRSGVRGLGSQADVAFSTLYQVVGTGLLTTIGLGGIVTFLILFEFTKCAAYYFNKDANFNLIIRMFVEHLSGINSVY